MYTQEQICKGDVPWKPFHYVGIYVLPGHLVTEATLQQITPLNFPDAKDRDIARKNANAVLIACKAINRMMGKPESSGMHRGEDHGQ